VATARGKLTRQFGKSLREARLKARFTQESLAHAAGVHPTYISQVERGILSPTLDKLESLAKALELPAHTLVRRAEK